MATIAAPAGYKWWNGGRSPFNVSYGKLMMWYFLMSDAFTFGAFLISYGTIRFSVNAWPDPNQVFSSAPFLGSGLPLVFVSIMTFILIASSVTMVLAVHEGHNMNRKGVVKYMIYTIVGGFAFLGCQAWEWTHLLTGEHTVMLENGALALQATTVKANPWGAQVDPALAAKALATTPLETLRGIYESIMHHSGAHISHDQINAMGSADLVSKISTSPDFHVSQPGAIAFGGYFFGITGFHGFHVFSGVVINIVILINAMNGTYERRGHYEMVEKVGLYWHFVDLVWVFVFLCFYLV
jgi:cytochrome c oxidase subunit III